MDEDFVTQSVPLPTGELRILQPTEGAEIPDAYAVEWAPLAPYWAVLWRSGVALARELDQADIAGRRVIELGCGLALPSIAAARAGASVLATDVEPEPLALAQRNAELNDVRIETARIEWGSPDDLIERGPFDLVVAGDVLYERVAVSHLLDLLPRLAPRALLADPGRPAAEPFLEQVRERWEFETREDGVVTVYDIALAP